MNIIENIGDDLYFKAKDCDILIYPIPYSVCLKNEKDTDYVIQYIIKEIINIDGRIYFEQEENEEKEEEEKKESIYKTSFFCFIKKENINNLEVLVSIVKDSITKKIYIDFNRSNGCAFQFQKFYLTLKFILIDYIDVTTKNESQSCIFNRLNFIEKKLSFWT